MWHFLWDVFLFYISIISPLSGFVDSCYLLLCDKCLPICKCYILEKALTTYKTCNVHNLEFTCWLHRIWINHVSAALNIIAPQQENLSLGSNYTIKAILWLSLQFLIAEFEKGSYNLQDLQCSLSRIYVSASKDSNIPEWKFFEILEYKYFQFNHYITFNYI